MSIGYGTQPGGGAAPGAATWTPEGVTTITVGGVTSGTDLGNSPISIETTLRDFLYPYTAPTVSLNSSPATLIPPNAFEFGNAQTPINLSATTVRRSNPITSVIFQISINGAAYTTINTVGSPNPAGGVETYSDSPPAPVAVSQVGSQAYRSTVGDGTSTTNSNVRTYTYVYPFYYGVGAQGLTGAQIGALTKAIVVDGNYTRAFTATNQVPYYAFPTSYPNLTSIIDQNGFNVTADWTLRSVSITGLDGTPQTYKVYEENNLITVTGFSYTFNH